MKQTTFSLALLFACAELAGAGELSGSAEVISGDMLRIEGTTVHLAGIAAPPLTQLCLRNGKTIPCGTIARSALLDLVTAAEVTCRWTDTESGNLPEAQCSAGGFGINENMIYTGWALPLPGTRYGELRDGARADRRGLWATSYVRD